ncbi:MAG: phage holin family protein [Gemmatimonadaceae bacterium]
MKEFGRSRGLGVLLRDLAHGSADLLRGETRLARMEFTEVASSVGQGTARVALGGVLLLLGVLALASGLILLVGDQWLPSDQYWLAALVVMVITGAIAAWLARKGFARLSPTQLAPDQTVKTLREDTEWLKQQLTSGATSN